MKGLPPQTLSQALVSTYSWIDSASMRMLTRTDAIYRSASLDNEVLSTIMSNVISLLNQKKEIARILIENKCTDEMKINLNTQFDWCNDQLKLILGK